MASSEYKCCRKCGETKPLGEFHRDGRAKDGRCTRCKSCRAAHDTRWAKANPERKAALNRRWNKANPERRVALDKRRLARHPQKALARRTLKYAVRRGHLAKPNHCDDCGERVEDPRNLHGHHADYSKPLEVEWLCRKCHLHRHGKKAHLP